MRFLKKLQAKTVLPKLKLRERELSKTGLVVVDGNPMTIVDFLKLENLTVKGDLEIVKNPLLTELPAGLKVVGDLDLRDTKITKLPDGLEVGGYLMLNRTKTIKELPKGLKVGDILSIPDTGITSLPPDLKVGRRIHISTDMKPTFDAGEFLNKITVDR